MGPFRCRGRFRPRPPLPPPTPPPPLPPAVLLSSPPSVPLPPSPSSAPSSFPSPPPFREFSKAASSAIVSTVVPYILQTAAHISSSPSHPTVILVSRRDINRTTGGGGRLSSSLSLSLDITIPFLYMPSPFGRFRLSFFSRADARAAALSRARSTTLLPSASPGAPPGEAPCPLLRLPLRERDLGEPLYDPFESAGDEAVSSMPPDPL
mmetsp:Transcript_77099/g.221503  ORF Transcript_77099/g.221503 Transcript_77099/m.221503 type:complete len:208 (+) Transcript_77099:1133-1756(+)